MKKFAKENFENVVYINMLEETGIKFLNSLVTIKSNGDERRLIIESIKSVCNSFEDNSATVVIIDEIQESSIVYNKIRSFNRNLNARFIVTGSHLGRIINDTGFWDSIGDTYDIIISTLTFREFLRVVNKNAFDIFNTIDLYEDTNKEKHDVLRKFLDYI